MFEELNEDTIIKILMKEKKLSKNQVEMARNISDTINTNIEKTLLELGFITENQLFNIHKSQDQKLYLGNLPNVIADKLEVDWEIFNNINKNSKNFSGIVVYVPIKKWQKMFLNKKFKEHMKKNYDISENENYFILTNEPYNLSENNLLQKLQASTKTPLRVFFLTSNKFKKYLLNIKKRHDRVKQITDILNKDEVSINIEKGVLKTFLNEIVNLAIETNTSDIHFEPDANTQNIRFRKDGVLQFISSVKKEYNSAFFTLINDKTKQNDESGYMPLDGQYTFEHEIFGLINIRWAENRSIYGRHIVLRILNNDVQALTIDTIGYSERNKNIIKKILQEPNGIILITGPTGSGKTNTLAAILKYISSPEKKILSLEDPVEIKLPIIQQIQINEKNKLTAHAGIKSFLRQDPDSMFIGEIRDEEMANHAIMGAMTGHLMFATLHTNDALSSIIRLTDIGISKLHIANSVRAVIAQRLIRKVCNKCKIKVTGKEFLDEKYLDFSISDDNKNTIYKHNKNGCEHCSYTGYDGRIPIAEIFILDKEVQNKITEGKNLNDIESTIKDNGYKNLMDNAIEYIKEGKTDIDEVLRVLGSTNNDSVFNYDDYKG